MIIGIVLTICFQSSAATMAITMTLITTGMLDFRLATAIMMTRKSPIKSNTKSPFYLNEVSKGEISSNSAKRIKAMYKIIGEMESLGDSGESISRILKRAQAHNKHFDKDMIHRLNLMMDKVSEAYFAMKENLSFPYHRLKDISNTINAETKINLFRDQLRDEHINNIENPNYNYQTGVYYMDIVAELERMGDFIINISEAVIEENLED